MAAPMFVDVVYDGTITVYENSANNTFEARPKINFNTSQWRLENYGIVVDASQTFNPGINPYAPQLRVTGNYAGHAARVNIAWNVWDWGTSKSANTLQPLGSSGGTSGMDLVLTARYDTGVVFTQGSYSCTYRIIIQFMFVPLVANPTVTPQPPDPNITKDGNDPPPPFQWPWEKWDTTTKILAGAFAVTALVLVVRPSAPATIISSGYRAYRRRNS